MKPLPFLLFGLLGLVVVSGAVSAGPAAPPPAWGPAIEVPGTGVIAGKDDANVISVSCTAGGNCAAGGYAGPHAFVVDGTNGSWGSAIEVPGTASLSKGGDAAVESISCAQPGSCTAGGYYADYSDNGSDHFQAFLAEETNGSWGSAIEVPGTATLNSGDYAGVNSISCATAGNCVAGGSYSDAPGTTQAFVVEEQNGSWGDAIEVPDTPTLNKRWAEVDSVSCATAGNCAAGGFYSVGSYSHAFLVDETNGSWGNAIKVPPTAPLKSSDYEQVDSVSCATAGNCVAGGDHGGRAGGAFVVDETNGSWGKAIDVPGTRAFGWGDVESVSCGSAGNCAAGGWTADHGAFVADERNGSWGTATFVSGYVDAEVNSVSCPTAGNCVAGGDDDFADYGDKAFVIDETNGRWGNVILASGPGIGRDVHVTSQVSSVSCGTAGSCAAGGYHDHYDDRVDDVYDQAFVLSSVPALSLNAGGTRCNGGYAGTGNHVVVPAGDTCTLVPGTHVTGNVTVSHGGTLNATGVKIGGDLTIAGSATLCQSRIRGDLKAASPGGTLEIGGQTCVRGNTFLHDIAVENDRHNVTIRRNTIAGDLIVLNDHGKIDSIRGNTVGNLHVAHSGPVAVIDNHAKGTIRCTANKRQTGRGNRARGKNTCPK